MKKKVSIYLNIVLFIACVCSLAFGVYSANNATLEITGELGFTAHNCEVSVYGYIYGHAIGPDEKPVTTEVPLKKSDNSDATSSNPLHIDGTTASLSFGEVYFSDLGSSLTKPEDITIVLTITNTSQYIPVLMENTATGTYSNFSISCSNPLHVLYTDETDKTTTLVYTLRATESDGKYAGISEAVAVSIDISFSEIKTDIVGKTSEGWAISGGALTSVPTKSQYGSETLIIPSRILDDNNNATTPTPITAIGSGGDIVYNWEYTKVIILKGSEDIILSDGAFTATADPISPEYSPLQMVDLPSNVTKIGKLAFYLCSSLKSIIIPDRVTSIGYQAFYECRSLTSATIGSGVTNIFTEAFAYCSNLISITIPKGVSKIRSNSFIGCNSLTSVTIPDSVTSIESSAFSGCERLTSITIPSSVNSMGSHAFSFCSGLTSIIIPSSVNSIGHNAFRGCSGLRSITIPDGVSRIEDETFAYCTGLTNFTIPSSVTSIGVYAFAGCSNLTSATFKTTSDWYVGESAGATTTPISSSNLANTSTAASNLTIEYVSLYWTRTTS